MTRFKDAFDAVQADDALKTLSTQAVIAAMREERQTQRPRRLIPIVALAVCLLAALGLGGHHLYFTPTTVLSIDVNPSLEMDINRFDRVTAVNGYNDDGVALAEALNVRNMAYDDAVDALMEDPTILDALARGEELSIAVVQSGDDTAQSDAVLAYVSDCMAHHENAHCYSLASDQAQLTDAHDVGLSCGKYHMYQELLTYDPAITPEDVKNKTMRELRDLLAQYQGTNAGSAQTEQGTGSGFGGNNGACSANGNGQMYGNHGHHGRGHE